MIVISNSIEQLMNKGGKFRFATRYDDGLQHRLVKAAALAEASNSLPALPETYAMLEEELISRSIFGTAAIEGNKSNENKVREIWKAERDDCNENRDYIEIKNLKYLYKKLEDSTPETGYPVTEEEIRDTQKTITKGVDYYLNTPGNYRNSMVKVGNREHGGVYTPPRTLEDIKSLMSTFCKWINSHEMLDAPPLLRAALTHYHLAKIHPFQDGNGRTARYMEALILKKSGLKLLPFMLANFYHVRIGDYYRSFSSSQNKNNREDFSPFLELFLEGVIQSAENLKERLLTPIKLQALKDLAHSYRAEKKINQRQYDLIVVLLETGKRPSLHALFTDPVIKHIYRDTSESTARRDLKKLTEQRLLKQEDKQYHLNDKILS